MIKLLSSAQSCGEIPEISKLLGKCFWAGEVVAM